MWTDDESISLAGSFRILRNFVPIDCGLEDGVVICRDEPYGLAHLFEHEEEPCDRICETAGGVIGLSLPPRSV